MSETALKFGPEWLRVLSHGTPSSPPSSPGPVKFKLADHRYGREEMLALFSKDFPPPDGLHNLGSLYIDHIQEPLALLPMNVEEQRIWQRCVNSEAVLRGPGRAPINGAGRGRGGSVDRGRGRGRGVGAPYYNRGHSYDEENEIRGPREAGPPGMPLRNKGYERSQSMVDSRGWGVERNVGERTVGIVEERSGAVSPQKGRAATDNWRSRGSEEEGDRWRGLVHSRSEKWGTRGGWRDREIGGVDGEWEETVGRGHQAPPLGARNSSSSRPPWDSDREKEGHRRQWDEDNLPEWATESAAVDDKGGSFDATGAFHAPGSSSSDEEDEVERKLEGHKSKQEEECDVKETEKKRKERIEEHNSNMLLECSTPNTNGEATANKEDDNHLMENSTSLPNSSSHAPVVNGVLSEEERIALCSSPKRKEKKKNYTIPLTTQSSTLSASTPVSVTLPASETVSALAPTLVQTSSSTPVSLQMESIQEKVQGDEDNLEHMQSVADDLVAKLVEDDEPRPLGGGRGIIHHPPPGGFLPTEPIPPPPPEDQWYYTDPQGDIQGPFSSADMHAWCKAGYFKSSLLLRRQCDDKFAQLGDLIRVFGRLPFLPGPVVPPLKVSELVNAQKAQAERERYEMMQAQIMQKQIYQQQNTIRQQQVLQSLQNLDEWSSLTSAQQHQLFMQHMMALPPIVPPTLPVTLQTTTSTTANNNNNHHQPSSVDLRSSMPSSSTPPLPQQPDPIQALVAQMSTSSSPSIPPSTDTPMPQPPPSSSPMGGESPLQKLLLQLQRGSQGGVGASLTTSGAAPIIAGHPSNLGTIPPPTLALEKSTDQFDAIQSLMSQLTKMQMQPAAENVQEDPRQREEEQKRIEDERRQFEEQKRAEEERIKIQELKLQEERIKEEERRKELEAKNQRLEEELRRIQEEQIRIKREEDRIKELESKRLMERKTAEALKREEEQKKQQLKQKQRQEEEARKKEEARKLEEAKKAEEEDKRKEEKRKEEQRIREEKKKEEEERKRKKEEKERQHQIQIQEEMRRIALEEERKRMQQLAEEERKKQQEEQAKRQQQIQQQKAAMQEKKNNASTAWNNKQLTQEKSNAPSLAEIQKAQEIKERKEREVEAQREAQRQKEAQKQAAEEKKKQEANLKWAARVSHNSKGNSKAVIGQPPQPPVKSLLEIQKEEEKELKKRQEKEQAERSAAISHLSLNSAGVWGSAAQSLSWANRASSGSAPTITLSNSQGSQQQAWGSNTMAWSAIAQSNTNTTSSGWNSETTSNWNPTSSQNSGGFWESPDTVKSVSSGKSSTQTSHSNRSPPKTTANTQTSSSSKNAGVQAVNSINKVNKKKNNRDESENVKKLFSDSISPADNFTQWCKSSLHSMKVHASIDIPTFVGFLADVESPYEVHDYIRSYLGDSKEVKEFAKQYLERRSKARNAQKEKHEEDNILAPAPAVNPVSNLEFQEVKTRLKKGRKKMQKVDSSILGFSVSALERVDVEDGN